MRHPIRRESRTGKARRSAGFSFSPQRGKVALRAGVKGAEIPVFVQFFANA